MILETITATSIYVGAITYLASDNPAQFTGALKTPVIAAYAKPLHSVSDGRVGGAPNVDGFEHLRYIMLAQREHINIWAKDDGEFEEWAK